MLNIEKHRNSRVIMHFRKLEKIMTKLILK